MCGCLLQVGQFILSWEGCSNGKKKAKYYYELAAIKGNVYARHQLGCVEGQAGNHQRTMKHFILAAKAGEEGSLDMIKVGFRSGYVMKDEYENTLRAYQKSQDEMKSEARDKAADRMDAVAHMRAAQRGDT